MTEDKEQFIKFVQSLAWCDHMGDVCNAVDGILDYLGIPANHPMLEKYDSEQWLVGVQYALNEIYGIGYAEED